MVAPIVCLCGSTRFVDEFNRQRASWTRSGWIVLSLDELPLRKIDIAHLVYILNVGGYVGVSTRREIAYARMHNKMILYLEPLTAQEG
jgi:hypothetical protein